MKTILILGQLTSSEVQLVYNKAIVNGHKAYIFDSTRIPDEASIDYSPISAQCTLYIQQKAIAFSQISGVFWVKVDPPHTKQENNIEVAGAINYENTCLLQLLLTETQANWVNSFKAIQFHRIKPKQLSLAKQLGANIPATYVGNNHAKIADFLLLYPKAIVKPVHGGQLTRMLNTQEHEMHSFCEWAKYPITLQAYIPGENIRTYIVGDFMVTALIQSTHINTINNDDEKHLICDYRNAPQNTLIPMQLPIEIQQLAVRIMRALHMQFTAIDWRLTPSGQFVFLEANPAPMFANAQTQLKVEIDQAIVNLLTA